MSLVQFFGHTTYLLLAISYVVRDIAWLRAISIPASICSILFSYFAPAEPLWLVICWNIIFLVVNTIQLILIYRDGRTVAMSNELADFASIVSPALSASQSMQLLRLANRETVQGPRLILEETASAQELILILDGNVEISQNGFRIGECGKGSFLGEISFLTNERHTATVLVPTEKRVELLRWDQSALRSFSNSRPQFHVALQQCLATNLVRKFNAAKSPTEFPAPAPAI